MKTKPSTEYVLLGSLMSGARHGYEIMQFLDTGLDSTWRVGTSQLYALLKRLERAGLLESSVKTEGSRPSKRVFNLTEAGRGAFMDWLRAPTSEVRHFRLEFISKLFFFQKLSLKGGRDLIDAQIKALREQREQIRRKGQSEEDPFRRLVCGFKTETVESRLKWLSGQAMAFVSSMGNHEKSPESKKGSK